jgi:protein-L-isoaspartate(D-aspartate) O-methyltransferase
MNQREQMVVKQLEARGITDPCILTAMRTIEREWFVEPEYVKEAYSDHPLPIGFGQTISQPYVVARMCELAQLSSGDVVLDIGSGSGYQAAVLSKCVARVIGIERIKALADEASIRLKKHGFDTVTVYTGDGYQGAVDHAPFDAIISAGAVHEIPEAWKDQLAVGGSIVVPCYSRKGQELIRVVKETESKFITETYGLVTFVPLIEQH